MEAASYDGGDEENSVDSLLVGGVNTWRMLANSFSSACAQPRHTRERKPTCYGIRTKQNDGGVRCFKKPREMMFFLYNLYVPACRDIMF